MRLPTIFSNLVPETRVELARPCGHYPLKVACLPIPPSGRISLYYFNVPKTGLEPARP